MINLLNLKQDVNFYWIAVCRIILMDDAMDCPMSFVDFLYAFQIQFYYCGKFTSHCFLISFGWGWRLQPVLTNATK